MVLGHQGQVVDQKCGAAWQATYDGHPLYTYVGDSALGQANGNGINLNGGPWHEVTVSGT
jgi:predicted lipoprotein with Yx(FWY)xxD motif